MLAAATVSSAWSRTLGFFTAPFDVNALVVRGREWLDEECIGDHVLVEDTTAWDDEADCLTRAASWKAGDDGAVPGVLVLSIPRPGVAYQQEYYEGEAEDWAKVL